MTADQCTPQGTARSPAYARLLSAHALALFENSEMSEPSHIKEEYRATFAQIFPKVLRGFSVILVCMFCTLLASSHFLAWMKAQYGLNGFLLVNAETERAFTIWSFVNSHRWLGIFYCLLTITLTFSVGRKRSSAVLLSWVALLLLLAAGSFYLSEASYLGAKFLAFRS